jgi:hypothetical protein
MFQYLILRGISDILRIFNYLEEVDSVGTLQQDINDANAQAKLIWDDLEVPFSMRLVRCQLILGPVVSQVAKKEAETHVAVPASVAECLDDIFHRHYNKGNFSLIGCADNSAYGVQENYAGEIVSQLRKISPECATRATVVLGKVYGSTGIPLLSISSVSALWDLANSAFYKKQLSLVSPVI